MSHSLSVTPCNTHAHVTHLAELAPTHHGGVVPVIATVHRGQTHWPDVVIEHYLKKNIIKISNKSMLHAIALLALLTSLFNLTRAMSLLKVLLTKSGLMNTLWIVCNQANVIIKLMLMKTLSIVLISWNGSCFLLSWSPITSFMWRVLILKQIN